MSVEAFVLRAEIALCVVILIMGAITALASANQVKRVAGVLIANVAAVLAAAALTSGALPLAGVVLAATTLIVGCALIVRLQERYSGVETREQDAADADAEPRESNTP